MRRLVHRAAPEVEIVPPELDGLRLVVPSAYRGVYGEGYEPKITAALTRLVQPGYVCADLGANVGFFSMLMALRAGPRGRVVAFEPREDMAEHLKRNVALNEGRVRIELRRAAVTDGATDNVQLYSGAWGTEVRSTVLRGFAEREAPTGRRVMTVPAVRLDDCFAAGERLDVVKMDIEGAEAVAPLGAQRILAEQRPVFVVEFHREVGWPAIGHFVDAGYRFEKCDGTRIETPADPESVPSYFVAVPG